MKIISYVVCGLGLIGSFFLVIDGDVTDGIMGFALFGFFLALTINAKN